MKTFSTNRLSLLLLAAFFMATLWSCQKEASNVYEPIVTEAEAQLYTEETTEAEASLDDVDDIAFTAAEEEGAASTDASEGGRHFLPTFEELRKRIGDCATVTVTPNNDTYPKTVVIDFGEGCIGRDGKFRKGKLELHFTAPIRQSNAVVTLKYVDFFLNRASIKGKKIFKNKSENGVHKFSLQAVGISVEYPNGRGYKFNGQKDVTQIAGMDTRIIRDDVYEIERKATIIKGDGLNIHIKTKTPLIRKVACHWISNGVLEIKIQSRVFLLDYGYPNNGECDNKALLTWNNGQNEKIVTLP
jgi:hypothetical protein